MGQEQKSRAEERLSGFLPLLALSCTCLYLQQGEIKLRCERFLREPLLALTYQPTAAPSPRRESEAPRKSPASLSW